MNLLCLSVALCSIAILNVPTNVGAESDSNATNWSATHDLLNSSLDSDSYEDFTDEQKKRGFRMVTHGLNEFAVNLFKNMSVTTKGNFVCVPLSVSLALSMAVFGSRNDTKAELVKLLGLSIKETHFARAGFRQLLDSFLNYKQLGLHVANTLYVAPDGIKPLRKFTYITSEFHHSSIDNLDSDYTQYTRKKIMQKWITTQGDDATAHILSMSDITFDPMFVLASEVYLRTDSMLGFNPEHTHVRRFWENHGFRSKARFMFACDRYRYGELADVDAKFVELPYANDDVENGVSMFIVLPRRKNGLHKLQRRFNRVTMDRLFRGEMRSVHVYLPRFEIENFLWLETPLKNMGLETTFSEQSNFTKIVSSPFLSVRGGGHAASIRVTENDPDSPRNRHTPLMPHSLDLTKDQEIVRFMVDHPFIAIVATRSSNPIIIQIARFGGPMK